MHVHCRGTLVGGLIGSGTCIAPVLCSASKIKNARNSQLVPSSWYVRWQRNNETRQSLWLTAVLAQVGNFEEALRTKCDSPPPPAIAAAAAAAAVAGAAGGGGGRQQPPLLADAINSPLRRMSKPSRGGGKPGSSDESGNSAPSRMGGRPAAHGNEIGNGHAADVLAVAGVQRRKKRAGAAGTDEGGDGRLTRLPSWSDDGLDGPIVVDGERAKSTVQKLQGALSSARTRLSNYMAEVCVCLSVCVWLSLVRATFK